MNDFLVKIQSYDTEHTIITNMIKAENEKEAINKTIQEYINYLKWFTCGKDYLIDCIKI